MKSPARGDADSKKEGREGGGVLFLFQLMFSLPPSLISHPHPLPQGSVLQGLPAP